VKPPFVGNLLLKINSKLGGENSCLQKPANILNKPTLVIGIDVNHPGIGDHGLLCILIVLYVILVYVYVLYIYYTILYMSMCYALLSVI
jgi:hypothetical protein